MPDGTADFGRRRSTTLGSEMDAARTEAVGLQTVRNWIRVHLPNGLKRSAWLVGEENTYVLSPVHRST